MSAMRSVAGRSGAGCHNLNVMLNARFLRIVAMVRSCLAPVRDRVGVASIGCASARQEYHMRYAALVAASLMLVQPALAEKTPEVDPRASLGVVQQWIYNYRVQPDYAHVPAAVRVLFHSQTFKEPENAGIYLGFVAGAIGSNPAKAEKLIAGFFPVAPEDEWVIVRAIAYSGLPDSRNVLRRVAPRMPARQVMIDSYLASKLPTLTDIPLEEIKPGVMDKL